MNYSIIKDTEELEKFITWLPDLLPYEIYYVSLLVRSKYCTGISHIKSDKLQLKRFTTNKERLFQKLKQLECPIGSYRQKDTIVPQEGLAVYITLNPRDMQTAAKNGLIKLASLITQPYSGYNPHQEIMSEIQKATSRRIYVDFDFDNSLKQDRREFNKEIKSNVLSILNPECINFLETRGGVHVMVDTSKISPELNKTWYRKMDYLKDVDQISTSNLIPIPGCCQGDYTPRLYTVNTFNN